MEDAIKAILTQYATQAVEELRNRLMYQKTDDADYLVWANRAKAEMERLEDSLRILMDV